LYVSALRICDPKFSAFVKKKNFHQKFPYILCKFVQFYGLYISMDQCGDVGIGPGTCTSVRATNSVKIRWFGEDVNVVAKRPKDTGGETTRFSKRLFSKDFTQIEGKFGMSLFLALRNMLCRFGWDRIKRQLEWNVWGPENVTMQLCHGLEITWLANITNDVSMSAPRAFQVSACCGSWLGL